MSIFKIIFLAFFGIVTTINGYPNTDKFKLNEGHETLAPSADEGLEWVLSNWSDLLPLVREGLERAMWLSGSQFELRDEDLYLFFPFADSGWNGFWGVAHYQTIEMNPFPESKRTLYVEMFRDNLHLLATPNTGGGIGNFGVGLSPLSGNKIFTEDFIFSEFTDRELELLSGYWTVDPRFKDKTKAAFSKVFEIEESKLSCDFLLIIDGDMSYKIVNPFTGLDNIVSSGKIFSFSHARRGRYFIVDPKEEGSLVHGKKYRDYIFASLFTIHQLKLNLGDQVLSFERWSVKQPMFDVMNKEKSVGFIQGAAQRDR